LHVYRSQGRHSQMAAVPDWAYYFTMRLNAGWLGRSSMVHGAGRRTAAMKYVAAALMFLLLGTADPSLAQPFPRRGGDGGMQSLDSIVGMIRQRFPGQVSDVQGPFGGRYRVKWLTPDGRVLWIDADARTGQILGVDGGGGGGGPGPRNFAPPDIDGGGGGPPPWANGRGRGRGRDR
jgi:hypothetical protein